MDSENPSPSPTPDEAKPARIQLSQRYARAARAKRQRDHSHLARTQNDPDDPNHMDPGKRRFVQAGTENLKHDPAKCRVCQHPFKDLIERFYLQAGNYTELRVLAKLRLRELDAHFRATGLEAERANNTDAFYARMITYGWENLSPSDVTPEMLQKTLWMIDKLNGRIIDRHVEMRPSKIIYTGLVSTEAITETKTEADKVKEGKVVKALGPAEEFNGRD